MKRWRPTSLALATRHCPAALGFYEQGVERDRSIFTAGIAAHAVLQAVAEFQAEHDREIEPGEAQKIGAGVAENLIGEGRSFEGHSEPPLPPDGVWDGIEIAEAYLATWPVPHPAKAEAGLAVDAEWQPTAYRQGWLGHIFDLIFEQYDFETDQTAVVLRDYKSSWSAGAGELRTIQRKVAAVVGAAHHPDAERIVLEIVNLRTGGAFRRELFMADDGGAILEGWRREIASTIGALDGTRAPAPGGGCVGCPYLWTCDHARDYLDRASIIATSGSAQEAARAYAVAVAAVGYLRDALKPHIGETAIEVDGWRVGYVTEPRRKVRPDAWETLLARWEKRGGEARGLLKAANLGLSQIEAAAKVMYPEKSDRDTRENLISALVEPYTAARFKVERI